MNLSLSGTFARLWLWALGALALCDAACIFANDAGGGAAGVGANVTLTTTGTTATLANGVVTAIIEKSTGKVTSYTLNGTQMLDTSGLIYYSLDGGTSFDIPSGCVYSATASTTDMVDISCKRAWNSTAGYKHVLDIDVHWVLRRGDTGLYGYVVLDHPAAYPAAGFGEFRVVWKLPHDSTNYFFERGYVDTVRHWQMESYYDQTHATSTGIAEVIYLTTGVRAGKYDCKYEYAGEYQTLGCWGHASNTNKKGVWMVMGGYEYLNDGPIHQDLTIAESYSLIHFGRNHFGGSSTSVAAGEAWRKIYGPHLLYCNSTATTTNPGDVLWADAQAQTTAEVAAWPYSWLASADYPLAAGRGTVTGKLIVTDALKPAVSAASAWVGLAAPEDANGNWQFQGKGYQFWVRADAAGNFSIPDVRPGTYTLYAFTDGAVGDFSKIGIVVAANATNAQGNLTWTIAHPGASIAWEIGTPNRSASEFKHGSDYYEPFLWDTYCTELASPLEYTIGTSTPAANWNYAHSGHVDAGVWTPWKWRIHFNLAAVPASGNATLTLAFAGSESARMDIYVNDEANLFARFYPPGDGGNNLIREGIHGKYGVSTVTIPVAQLSVGANTITLIEGRTSGATEHVMYDYLNLELPAFPPPPPSSGRSLLWKGGSTTAANTWDIGTTASFLNGAAATAFGVGDAVTFDATGSNTTSVTLTGSIEPNSVTFSGTKNYVLAGTGALTGQMALAKSGTGTLSIGTAQTFAGPTTITGGQIIFTSDTANASGLGTSDITLKGGTLAMSSNFGTYNSASWNLIVPTGFSGTLNCDARCDLYGELNGGGTLTLYVPDIRTTFFGDWSGFSGQINVTSDAGGGDFRIGTSYSPSGVPAGALNLGAHVSAYFAGTTSAGLGTFIPIGELTSTDATASLKGGPSTSGNRIVTYRIGGRGTDATYLGSIAEQTPGTTVTSLAKIGTGIWTMSGTANLGGTATVEAGTLRLTSTLTLAAGATLEVQDAAAFTLASGTVNAALHTTDGGTLSGAGAVNGDVTNDGAITSTSGTLSIVGALTHNGAISLSNDASIAVSGSVTLAGTLDFTPAAGIASGTTFTILSKTSAGAVSGTFTDKPEGATFAAGGYNWLITYVGGDGNDITLTNATAQQNWRYANFGTVLSTGTAADTADPNTDGESNLMEFATAQNPTATTRATPTLVKNGATLELTYSRSDAALADAVAFLVEWRDDLTTGTWSTAGVTEQILSDNSTVQSVRASVAAGASGKRFLRLRVVK